MLNEEDYIGACLDGFRAQTYPNIIEILVIDGGSADRSHEVVQQRAQLDPRIREIHNPRRQAAAAANLGVSESKGVVLCFLSAHGVPGADYVERAIEVMQRTGAVGVGGRYDHVGTDPVATAIGLAMASPFGMASPHRIAAEECEVDTISHPLFKRQALIDIGGYDETLLRNEDYETNLRLRLNGGRLIFTPSIASVYRPRRSLSELGKQFWDYGYWKAEVMYRHPESTRPRHFVPPVAVAGSVALAALSVLPSVVMPGNLRARQLAWVARAGATLTVMGYGTVLGMAARDASPRKHEASTMHFLTALPVIHGAWGAGLLVGLVGGARRRLGSATNSRASVSPAGTSRSGPRVVPGPARTR
jgi:succinoglycan biosynthesis protein ExoA